jgi:hypothetical protein
MKKYLLFVMDSYYPSGGWGDFVDSFEDKDEAVGYANRQECGDWYHVVDIEQGGICASGRL